MTRIDIRTRTKKCLIIVGGWTLFGLYMAAQYYVYRTRAGLPASWVSLLVQELSYALLWAGFTPLVLWLAGRFPIDRTRWVRSVPIHMALSIVLAVAQKMLSGLFVGLYQAGRGTTFSWEAQFQNLLLVVDYGILLYWMILLMHYAIAYHARYQERELRTSQLETQLAHAQLQALKMQLHPHFLFNTLNAISVLIRKDPDIARRTVGRLSDLLRLTLENAGDHEVPLKTELEFLDQYLQIERTRFGDRLTVRLNVSRDLLEARVPNLILQPLVENAIKHGISTQRGPGLIEICAQRENGKLILQVRDNGPGLSKRGKTSIKEGVGLMNIRARLQQLYGAASTFDLLNGEQNGLTARVVIPFHTDPGPEVPTAR